MRVEKTIRRILKRGITVEDIRPAEQKGDGMEKWAWDIVNDVKTDPDFDMSAAKYGLDPEDVLEKTFVLITLDNEYDWGASHLRVGDYNEIMLRIGQDVYEDDRSDVMHDALMHELDHAARAIGGVMFSGTRGLKPIDWVKHPSEQSAMKAEIRNMAQSGYTDGQILASLFTEAMKERLAEDLPEAVEIVQGLIDQVRQEEDIIEPIT